MFTLLKSQAMKWYVEEVLQSGFIQLSTSAVVSGFFFAEMNDRGLLPMDTGTVKFLVPLPPIPAVLEQVWSAQNFYQAELAENL